MISIIITAHNNDFFLYETLDSINKSNVEFDYEILLGVDNCQITMDSIKNNLNKISKNVKIFLFPKVGTYVIRNSLAKISKFNDLLFVDSDDILTDDTLAFVCENLKKYDVAKYKFAMFGGNFNIDNIKTYKKYDTSPAGSFGIKKNVFLEMGGFEPWSCAADGEFQWRVEMTKKKVITKNNVGLYYRRHDSNLTIDSKTGMKSPIRLYYHSLKKEKIKNNKYDNIEKINVSEYLEINQNNIKNYKIIFENLKLPNLYNFQEMIENGKLKRSEALNLVLNPHVVEEPPKNEYKDLSVKSTIEQKKSQIDYDRVNYVFQNSNNKLTSMRVNKPTIPQQTRNNTSFLNKLNKKR
jgi:hypothetical protein